MVAPSASIIPVFFESKLSRTSPWDLVWQDLVWQGLVRIDLNDLTLKKDLFHKDIPPTANNNDDLSPTGSVDQVDIPLLISRQQSAETLSALHGSDPARAIAGLYLLLSRAGSEVRRETCMIKKIQHDLTEGEIEIVQEEGPEDTENTHRRGHDAQEHDHLVKHSILTMTDVLQSLGEQILRLDIRMQSVNARLEYLEELEPLYHRDTDANLIDRSKATLNGGFKI